MSEKLPRVTADEVIKELERAGFALARRSGSRKMYKNKEEKRVTIRYHAGRTIHPKLLKSILRDADLAVEKPKDLLKSRALRKGNANSPMSYMQGNDAGLP